MAIDGMGSIGSLGGGNYGGSGSLFGGGDEESNGGSKKKGGGGWGSFGQWGAMAQILQDQATSTWQKFSMLDDTNWLLSHFPNFVTGGGGAVMGGAAQGQPEMGAFSRSADMVNAVENRNQNQSQFDQSLNYKKQQDAESNALMEKWLQMQAGGGGNSGQTSSGMGWKMRS